MINRKSATIKVKLTSGKNGTIEIYTYTSLKSDESKEMTGSERMDYIQSEQISIGDNTISLQKIANEIEEVMKKYTENIKRGSIIWS